jgi:GDP-L-fucose synthase
MKNKKILVTGSRGFLGSHFVEVLKNNGFKNILTPSRAILDLLEKESIDKYLKVNKPEIVVHIAADIGGIGYSKKHPANQLYNNTLMNIMIQHSSYENGVEKFIGIGTVCSYPKFAKIPFKESEIWNGYPEETNASYGLSKKIMMEQTKAYNSQYGFNSIHLLMINLFGPGDDFDLETSHVIPAMIRKMDNAVINSLGSISLWGDGSPTREFLYVKDAARAILKCMVEYNSPNPINIGNGKEISIKDLVEKIKLITGFNGKIVWDKSKENGQPRRCLDVSILKNHLNFECKFDFEVGLKETYNFYKKNIKTLNN